MKGDFTTYLLTGWALKAHLGEGELDRGNMSDLTLLGIT